MQHVGIFKYFGSRTVDAVFIAVTGDRPGNDRDLVIGKEAEVGEDLPGTFGTKAGVIMRIAALIGGDIVEHAGDGTQFGGDVAPLGKQYAGRGDAVQMHEPAAPFHRICLCVQDIVNNASDRFKPITVDCLLSNHMVDILSDQATGLQIGESVVSYDWIGVNDYRAPVLLYPLSI